MSDEFTMMTIPMVLQPNGLIYLVKTGDLPSQLRHSLAWHKRVVPEYGELHMVTLLDLCGCATLGRMNPIMLTAKNIMSNENFLDVTFCGARVKSISDDFEEIYSGTESELMKIDGINKQFAKKLEEYGITSLVQIAGMTQSDLEKADIALRAKGRISQSDFPEQARKLLENS